MKEKTELKILVGWTIFVAISECIILIVTLVS